VSESRRLDQLPHRFADRTEIAEVRAAHGELAPGDASGVRYRLAGRVMGRRLMGKAAFLDLEIRSDLSNCSRAPARSCSPRQRRSWVTSSVSGAGDRSHRGELRCASRSCWPRASIRCQMHQARRRVGPRPAARRPMVNATSARSLRRAHDLGRSGISMRGFIGWTPVLQPLYGAARALHDAPQQADRIYLRATEATSSA
jgi:hypothetical protein